VNELQNKRNGHDESHLFHSYMETQSDNRKYSVVTQFVVEGVKIEWCLQIPYIPACIQKFPDWVITK